MGWWATKIRQATRHLTGHVSDRERAELDSWLTDTQRRLFESMHRADQRHGLDVVTRLRADGFRDPDLLLAGLLHDCSKGRDVRLAHRVAWSLGERHGEPLIVACSWIPGFRAAFERLGNHPEMSAALALQAGCSARTAELIRHQTEPLDPIAGVALRLADEAS